MDEQVEQTLGQAEGTPDDFGTGLAEPEDMLSQPLEISPRTLPDLDVDGDPLDEIPTDELPPGEREKVQKQIRDGWLRLSNKVDQTIKRLEEREREYINALQNPQRKAVPEQENFEGMTPQQIVEAIASRIAEQKVNEKLGKVEQTTEKTDAIYRQLQLVEARQHFPDLDRYQNSLVQLSGILEKEFGREGAMKFSVADMMHIIKGRESMAKRRTAPAAPRRAVQQPSPEASVARASASPKAVETSEEPSSMLEAFRMAQKHHGPYNPNTNR